MANFGDGVSTLLETYTKCLRLLKAFKGRKSDPGSTDPSGSDVQSLRKSIRSDRGQVRRAYSASLSQNGRRLHTGDLRSKSALERILKRLKGAITKLLRVAKIQEPMLDYGSLMSLSSSSRADTIKTMNRLSNRLSSSTGLPMEEGRPRSLAASHGRRDSSRGSPKYESHQRGARQASAKDTLARPSGYKTRKPSGRSERVSERGGGSSRHKSRHSEGHSSRSSIGIRSQQRLQSSIPNRMSYISTSSDSTKLGEISHRRSRLVRHSDESFWEEYHCKSTYPLQPYQVPVKEKKGLLRRIFGGEGRY